MPEEIHLPIYANSALFQFSINDVFLLFGINEPNFSKAEEAEKQHTLITTKIVMSPMHFKRFVEVAADLLSKYEEQFGSIPVDPNAIVKEEAELP